MKLLIRMLNTTYLAWCNIFRFADNYSIVKFLIVFYKSYDSAWSHVFNVKIIWKWWFRPYDVLLFILLLQFVFQEILRDLERIYYVNFWIISFRMVYLKRSLSRTSCYSVTTTVNCLFYSFKLGVLHWTISATVIIPMSVIKIEKSIHYRVLFCCHCQLRFLFGHFASRIPLKTRSEWINFPL